MKKILISETPLSTKSLYNIESMKPNGFPDEHITIISIEAIKCFTCSLETVDIICSL